MEKEYYYVNIIGEENLVFYTTSWDSVFCFLIDYYGGRSDNNDKRIIKNIVNLNDKIYVFELLTELEINFISLLREPLLTESADVRILDDEGNEVDSDIKEKLIKEEASI